MERDAFDTQTARTPPQSLEAEQSLLGAILVNNNAYERIADILEPQHFFDPLHQQVYETAAKLIGAGRLVNPVTLAPLFDHAERVGGLTVPQYLGVVATNATTLANVKDYANTIRDLYTRRQLILIGEDLLAKAYDTPIDFPPKEQIEEAEGRLYRLAEHGERRGGPVSARVVISEEINRANEACRTQIVPGVATRLTGVDHKLGGGLQPSDLIILAGRPSMGKSALATTIADNVRVATVIFSLEMSKEQIAQRMLSSATGLSTDKLRRGDLNEADWRNLLSAQEALDRRLQEHDLIIDDTGGISLALLRARARRAQRQHGIGLIIVDYLQLIEVPGSRDNRTGQVSEITKGLKALAKDLNVPVLALSQLSRNVESRQDKRPQLADLRESGSIEQDADVVMFVFREEYYVERDKPDAADTKTFDVWTQRMKQVAGKAEIIVGKQRHGPIGTINLSFNDTTTRFYDLADPARLPQASE